MRIVVLLAVIAVPLPGLCRAADEKSPTPAKALATLQQQIHKLEAERDKHHEAAKTNAARDAVWAEYRKDRDVVLNRVVELARQHPSDGAALEGLTWMITGGIGWGAETGAAFDELVAHHITSDRLEQVCLTAGIAQDPAAVRFLNEALKRSPHRSLRGAACLSLGRRTKSEAASARYLNKPEADLLEKDAEAYYERVVAEFSDVVVKNVPIGQRARAALFEMRNLLVGKKAPDIEGEDIDGKRFRLSEYRGKVVVLDFWGNW